MKYILLITLALCTLQASDANLHNLLLGNALKGKMKLPQKVGKNITVTDVMVKDTTQITTYIFDVSDAYLIEKALENKKDKRDINMQMREVMKNDFTSRACKSLTNPMSLLAMGAIYQSDFYSSDKVLEFTYSISKKDCK